MKRKVETKYSDNNLKYREIFNHYYEMHFKRRHSRDDLQGEYLKTYFLFKSYLETYLKNYDQKKAEVLDIACGLGHHLWAMRKIGFEKIKGIDLSEDNVKVCQESNLPVERKEMFSYLKGRKEEFDIIIFFDIIEHLKKDEAIEIISLAFQSLKKDGMFIVHTFNAECPYNLGDRYQDITHEIGYTVESLTDTLLLGGFNNNRILNINSYFLYHPNFLISSFRRVILPLLAFFAESVHRFLALCQGIILRNTKRNLVSLSWKKENG